MILSLLSLVLLLTGGNTSSSESQELYDQQEFNNRSAEISGGNFTADDYFSNNTSKSSEEKARNCTYMDVLNFLNLTKDNELYTMSRPTLNYKDKTKIYLDVMIYAILDVRQSDQTLITYIWIDMGWQNPHLMWNETDFCGISVFSVPTEALWMPDVTIEEMTERDKAPPTPFLRVHSLGIVEYRNDQVVTSTCRMHVYRFPFDVQNCNLSFKSVVHSDEELEIEYFDNNTALTAWSRVIMENQYEWLFEKQSGTNKTVDYFGFNQTVIVFTITMKRRSSFYIANFLLPVLFFLCLDLSSLLMSEGGDKIGFKVTVLLAVTVMQLILNEILPVSSDRIPLVVIYCIGIFALMLLSLMETILVKYLMEKDSASQDRDSVNDSRTMEERGIKNGASISDETADQTSSIDKEGSSSQLTELLEKVSNELGVIKKKVNQLGNMEQKSGYWSNVANRINKFFTLFYITAVVVFLCVLFPLWLSGSK